MSKVINLYGASCSGKSTLSAGLFAEMKMRYMSVELVHEYIKSWTYLDRKAGKFDQPFLFGEQSQREAILYGKVDYIISDSPLHLYGYYEKKYLGRSMVGKAIGPYLEYAQEQGIEYINFFLDQPAKYDTIGRFETAEESQQNHRELREYLIENDVSFTDVPLNNERVSFVMKKLGL